MTGYDDLIEQLRRESGVDVMGNWLNETLREAADALETLQAERDAARALAGRLFVGDRPDDTVAGLERWLLAIPRAEARELDAEVEIFCDVSEDARRALRPTSPGEQQ